MMITLENQKVGLELINELIKESHKSLTFKNELLKNPYTVIQSLCGSSFSLDTSIVVEDQSNPAYIYLNIPAKPNLEEIELSDEQLEMVSGGEILASVGVAAIIIGAGLAGAGAGYLLCKAAS